MHHHPPASSRPPRGYPRTRATGYRATLCSSLPRAEKQTQALDTPIPRPLSHSLTHLSRAHRRPARQNASELPTETNVGDARTPFFGQLLIHVSLNGDAAAVSQAAGTELNLKGQITRNPTNQPPTQVSTGWDRVSGQYGVGWRPRLAHVCQHGVGSRLRSARGG